MPESGEESRLIRQVYAGALQLDSKDREAYLDRVCVDRPGLRAKVAALLQAHSQDFLEADAFGSSPTVTTPVRSQPSSPQGEGQIVGPYILRRELGRGGMGVVYLADDCRLSRRVALKAINTEVSGSPHGRERLRREARAAAALSHPGIATVYAIEEIEEQLYIACEYVPGEPLRSLVKSGPVAIEEVADIGLQLARALAAAHSAGIVHRDIKPENIIKTPGGVVKVLDFGLARMESGGYVTQTGVVLGTPAYLSPEQALGQHTDFRSDLFALGLVLYELASGVNPFAAATITTTIARIVEHDPLPLSQLRPTVHPELERVIEKLLQKDPQQRYTSTQQLVVDLEELSAELAERRRTSGHRGERAYPVRPSAPRWWWQFHQLIVSAVYVGALYPAWHIRQWLPGGWGMPFFLVLLACTAAVTSLRLHLWFTSVHFQGELPAELNRITRRARWGDALVSLCLGAAGVAISDAHSEFAVLLVAMATSTLVAALVIEPSTTKAAFPPAPPAPSGSSQA